MLISAYRTGKFALQNFWRNFWLSFITLTMLVLTLVTVNILLVLNFMTDQAIQAVEDRVEVSVYFHALTPQTTVESAVSSLRVLPQVRDVATISAEEALDKFRRRHSQDEMILQSLEEIGGNPFGPSLIIKAQTVSDFEVILQALENPQFREDIREKDFSDYQDIVARIKTFTDRVRTFGMVLSGIFLLIVVLVVFNTVRMGLFIHREEIGIMKLVGASNSFIRAPFLLEMILLSLLAIGVTLAILFPLLAILEPTFALYVGGNSAGLVAHFTENGLQIFGLQFLLLMLLTMFSTSMAMRKYLKV